MIVDERTDAKAKVYPPPAETWTQHRFFSDCGVEWRLNGKPSKQAEIVQRAKPTKWQDEPSRVCGGNEWDKYYFFSEPATMVSTNLYVSAHSSALYRYAYGARISFYEYLKLTLLSESFMNYMFMSFTSSTHFALVFCLLGINELLDLDKKKQKIKNVVSVCNYECQS